MTSKATMAYGLTVILLAAAAWLGLRQGEPAVLDGASVSRLNPSDDDVAKEDSIESLPGQPEREPVLKVSSELTSESPQMTEGGSSPEEGSVPIAWDHPQVVSNIYARQQRLRAYAQMLETGTESEHVSLGSSMCAANELAVLIILDATGRSTVIENHDKGAKLVPATEDEYHYVSGGAVYHFRVGEFPEYDQAVAMRERFGNVTPIGELDLVAIEQRVAQALSYRSSDPNQ